MSNDIKKKLHDFIKNLPIIDVHEHIVNDELRLKYYKDYFAIAISNYLNSVSISSGISQKDIDFLQGDNSLDKKYEKFCAISYNIKNTYVFKGIDLAFQEIYGFSVLEKNYSKANKIFLKKNKLGITKEIATKFNIKCAINDVFIPTMQGTDYKMGNEILKNSARCDRFIMVQTYIREIENEFNTKLSNLTDFISIWEQYLEIQIKTFGACSVKIGVAYERDLKFNETTFDKANEIYDMMFSAMQKGKTLTPQEIKPLEDFLAHKVIESCGKNNLVVQIHTGIHEGNNNLLENSHPVLLNNLFVKYPDVYFDVFHIGYPYAREVAALVRTFPNVHTNFSWAYVLAPEFANDILEEYIGLLPSNKFSIFGGDYMHIEGSIGQLLLTREFLSIRFAKMIEENKITLEDAKIILYKIFYQNAVDLYNLEV